MAAPPTPPGRPRPPAGPGRFANRQDLSQGTFVPRGLPHGDRARFEQAQSTVPLPQRRGAAAPPGSPAAGSPGGPPPLPRTRLEQLLAHPSTRPGEPVTAGLPIGAGPGPVEAAATPSPAESDILRGLAMASTDPDMPIEIRAFGAFLGLLEDARSVQFNVVPVMSTRDFLDEGTDAPARTTMPGAPLDVPIPPDLSEPV